MQAGGHGFESRQLHQTQVQLRSHGTQEPSDRRFDSHIDSHRTLKAASLRLGGAVLFAGVLYPSGRVGRAQGIDQETAFLERIGPVLALAQDRHVGEYDEAEIPPSKASALQPSCQADH